MVTGQLKRRLAITLQRKRFPGSAEYWEQRYAAGGTSGAGSYGALADWKAEQINRFVAHHGVRTVVDFGCGDGNQLALSDYPSYVGLDVSRTAIQNTSRRFADDPSKSFLWYDPAAFVNRGHLRADVALSLDVILHLVEDDRFANHVSNLDQAAERFIVLFTEDSDQSPEDPHVRYRRAEEWLDLLPGWELLERIDGPHIHPSDADLFILGRN